MKRITFSKYFFHVCIIFCLTLTACKTLCSSEKAVSQSATASVTDSRRTFYRTLDSLSRQLCLSADSISIIFNTEFPTAFPSQMEGCSETPSVPQARKRTLSASRPRNASRSAVASPSFQVPSFLQLPSKPLALKIYGLHLNDYIEKKSVDSADLKDSVNTFTQSENIKSSTKQKSAPATSPHHYVFFIFVVLIICIIMYLKKRFQ